MEDIELVREVVHIVFKAKIGDLLLVVCLKGAPTREMRSEIEIMMKVPSYPSLIHPLLGVVDAGL